MEVIFSVPEPTRRSCQRPRRRGRRRLCIGRTGRRHPGNVLAELGEGIRATCRIAKPARQEHSESEQPGADKPDVKSLSSMLTARWKAGSVAESPKAQEVRAGQVRSFRITTLDPAARKIEVELVSKLRIQCSQTLHHARPAVRGFCKAIG